MPANRRLPNPPSRRLGSSSRRLDGSWRLAEQDGLWARWRWILATAAQKLEVNLRKRAKTAVVLDGLAIVEQLADSEQTAALAQMVRYCLEKGLLERCTVQETVATLLKAYEADGLSVFSDASYAAMGLAMPRVQEIYACLNRFRG